MFSNSMPYRAAQRRSFVGWAVGAGQPQGIAPTLPFFAHLSGLHKILNLIALPRSLGQ
ncbi:MAG: hypothetical protein ABFS56_20795 [Pseudomonadota bacterium]